MSRLDELHGMLKLTAKRLDEAKKNRMLAESQLALEKETEEVLAILAKRGSARLGHLVVAGLQSIYGPNYTFRRDGNKILIDDGEVEVELAERGGGLTEVCALLFRLLALHQGKGGSIRTLVLDEPLKSLDTETAKRASKFMRIVGERLGMNILMVTHRPELVEEATHVYRVHKQGTVTQIDLKAV